VQGSIAGKTPKDFENALQGSADVLALKREIQQFVTRFPMPGFDVATMKYKELD